MSPRRCAPGVLRRAKADGMLLTRPLRERPPERNRGQYIIDAVRDAQQEAEDRKHLANRLHPR